MKADRTQRSLREFCRLPGRLGYSKARELVRRSFDPLPARKIGRRFYIDPATFELWSERESARSSVDVAALVDEIARELVQGVGK